MTNLGHRCVGNDSQSEDFVAPPNVGSKESLGTAQVVILEDLVSPIINFTF